MKKLLALVLALVMTLSLCTISNAAFPDAKDVDASYEEAVAVLNGMGVFKGYEDGSFKPEGSITRAEVAAIVYRLYTGDVKDKQAGLYAGYGSFSDMAGAAWAAGYVGYCANAGFVKGYGNGKFGPSDPVTGYQALAMILRAVGYGKNGEFEGADWELHVAQIAQQLKVLKNVKGVSLKAAASRELVAELLFQVAANVPTVTYTPAFGYVTADIAKDVKDETLGWKNFKLAKSEDGEDAWGRPSYKWFSDDDEDDKVDSKETKYATIAAKPVMTFTEATSECDICEGLGESKEAVMTSTWTNGKESEKDDKLDATKTKDTKGAQGQLVEIYDGMGEDEDEYRMVVIDTYLAKVTKVVEEKTDKNGHVTRDAYMELDAYMTTNEATPIYVKGNDYEKDDYVLVNVNDDPENKVTITGLGKVKLVEIVAAAESFDGAQSKIKFTDPITRIIEDTEYLQAVQYKLNAAQLTDAKYTWFLDQYGNVIGSIAIETEKQYGVLVDMNWVIGTGAVATIRYFDGTEETVVVKSADKYDKDIGFIATDVATKYESEGIDLGRFGDVSDEPANNDGYQGYALYRVDTDSKDKTALQGAEDNTTIVSYVNATSIDLTAGQIKNHNPANNFVETYINKDTKFIVRETDDDDNYIYVDYTMETLPEFADTSIELFYVNCESSKYADVVYIKNSKLESEFGTYLWTLDGEVATRIAGDLPDYKLTVMIDGAEREIATGTNIAHFLQANPGKLFKVTFDQNPYDGFYGYVTDVKLINEANDDNSNASGVNYAHYFTNKANTLEGETLVVRNIREWTASYVLNAGEKVFNEKGEEITLTADDLKDKGVWVIANDTTKAAGDVAYIYVGTKLSANVGADVTIKDNADKSYTAVLGEDGKTFSATLDVDKTMASFTATAKDVNAKVINETSNSFTVVAEDSVTTKDYTVTAVTSESPTTGSIKYTVNFYDKLTHTIETTKTFTSTGLAVGTKTTADYPTDWILGEVNAVAADWVVDYVTPSVEVVAGQTANVTLNVTAANLNVTAAN